MLACATVESVYREERIARARQALQARGAAWLLLPPSADFRWLTGAHVRPSERLVALAVPRQGDPFVIVPRLEAGPVTEACPWLEPVVWDDHQRPIDMLLGRLGIERHPPLLLGEGFRVDVVLTLAGRTGCHAAREALAPLRAVKDQDEIQRLETAAAHADQVVEQLADHVRPGMTERELVRFACDRFTDLGDTEPWAIVASGPNSARPHHDPTTRTLAAGDVIVLDIGAYHEGYASDITRTFWVGAPPRDAERVYDIVRRAKDAATSAARPGATVESVDRAARTVIENAGYGEYFTHRTGHGLGLEIHEPPYLVSGSTARLEIGNVHSVEPGIYLPGRFGVRIEDIVVEESQGARALNRAPIDPLPLRVRV